eukprot:TRINITY_DN25645_c0_g1_i2.p1 TRINITY_DN25645_c0_g1~~TRINITY_DN25645_c0_g1_i2.p1  ORF type:complete len:165 (+),score=19.48 TRINITY_DN25645_c0_g1_i2:64-558(+)
MCIRDRSTQSTWELKQRLDLTETRAKSERRNQTSRSTTPSRRTQEPSGPAPHRYINHRRTNLDSNSAGRETSRSPYHGKPSFLVSDPVVIYDVNVIGQRSSSPFQGVNTRVFQVPPGVPQITHSPFQTLSPAIRIPMQNYGVGHQQMARLNHHRYPGNTFYSQI